ncbi:MAG: phage terminase large subunit [Deltaproteobacteria bacterium]|nr:phage terminase large subunit [Deltaproteobacteria bacterium]
MNNCEHGPSLRTTTGGCALCADEPAPAPASTARRSLVERKLLERSFARFFRAGWSVLEPSTPLRWAWPYQAVCDHLQALVEDWAARQGDPTSAQRIRDLLVTLPPGCLKSRLLAYLVPWAWLRWPQLRAIALSCNPRVSLRDSMYSRDVIASPWYQQTFAPSWQVRGDSDAKGLYSNTAGGFRAAMGFDARVVGERGDLIIVDDPHDPEEVESEAQRGHVHDRWESSIGNRVNDLGSSVRVGIAQRTHEDDWSARRIAEGWAHLDLPMLYEPDRACSTPLGDPDPRTEEGDCLHEERFPPAVIAAERRRVGERRWATLYQGRPAPAGGAMVKLADLRFWRRESEPLVAARPRGCYQGPAVVLPKDLDSVVIAGDLAGGKLTTKGDYNALVVVGLRGSSFYVLESWVKRAGFPEVQAKVRELARRYPTARKVIESAASGASLVASLESEIAGLVGQVAKGDKESRLESVLAFFEAGNVRFHDGAPGLDELLTSLTIFPNGAHDDDVDALSLALSILAADLASEASDRERTIAMTVLGHIGRHAQLPRAVNAALKQAGLEPLTRAEAAERFGIDAEDVNLEPEDVWDFPLLWAV